MLGMFPLPLKKIDTYQDENNQTTQYYESLPIVQISSLLENTKNMSLINNNSIKYEDGIKLVVKIKDKPHDFFLLINKNKNPLEFRDLRYVSTRSDICIGLYDLDYPMGQKKTNNQLFLVLNYEGCSLLLNISQLIEVIMQNNITHISQLEYSKFIGIHQFVDRLVLFESVILNYYKVSKYYIGSILDYLDKYFHELNKKPDYLNYFK